MTENNLQDPHEKDEAVSNKNDELETNKESQAESKGILSYSSKGSQSVISLFGLELTAPSGLKNPGIVYLAFIIINLFIFLVLRSFVSG
tara:strand:+ start:1281 stop:1547 length:267 start_codon:yes stop_codon:yes gene_type:complete